MNQDEIDARNAWYHDPDYGTIVDTKKWLREAAKNLLSCDVRGFISLSALELDRFARMLRAHGCDDVADMVTARAVSKMQNDLQAREGRQHGNKRWWR